MCVMAIEEKNMELQILQAAEGLFLEQGFAKTTMGQIAKTAGCNQALVHYYYRTKDNLFDQIFERKVRFMLSNMMEINSDGIPFEQKLVRMIGMHFDFVMHNPRLMVFVFNEATTNADHLKVLIEKLRLYPRQLLEQMEMEWQREIERGVFRPISFADLVLTIISLNVTPILMRPIFQNVLALTDEAYDAALQSRRQENIETILARLKR